jgi:DNA-binding response OmpR family regulator
MAKKVMIVDDDKEFLSEIKETLDLSGYEAEVVEDATLAVGVAAKVRPDVILLDIRMPLKSGFQVADEISHLEEFSHTPIIAMTAFFKDEYVQSVNASTIKGWLKKPFNPLDVIALIEAVLVERSRAKN